MAIDNRACLKADLDAELTAQRSSGSNAGGGYGYLATDIRSGHPHSPTHISFTIGFVCREGKAVVLARSTGRITTGYGSQVFSGR